MFAVVFCLATPACGSDISRCRIQLSWILSLCSSRAVSVNWCSGVLVWVCLGFHSWYRTLYSSILTGLVGPGLVCVGCPLGSLRCDCGDSHYFTILTLITSITNYYRVLPSVVNAVLH